jgi:hypothetical protein
VDIQKSAIRVALGAGIWGVVCTQTHGNGCVPKRAGQFIAMPGKADMSEAKY